MSALLEVRGLRIAFPGPGGAPVHPVDGVEFSLARGETLALVGESGSGKSLTGLALLNIVPAPGRIAPGSRVVFDGTEVTALAGEALRGLRGRRIGLVFQDPMASLNPVLTVGAQLREALTAHRPLPAADARARSVALLAEVGMPDPAARCRSYPHELSGGLRQRVLIAIALAGEPDLLVADEPTTALDVTVQAQILELLDRLRAARGMAVLLITHDLGIAAGRADRVAVMYAGQIVEQGPTAALFAAPAHPYTRALFRAIPRLDGAAGRLAQIPGGVPSAAAWPPGCRFHPRCAEALPRCAAEAPPVFPAGAARMARCWLAERAAP
jgi:oligopeptide/dipeptide ABC transporter ATP-binding protein